ncbi:Zinc-binding domain of primase-helicase [compost metagenome]
MSIHTSNRNDRPRKSFADLKFEAAGKWPYILQDLAPELSEAMSRAPHHVSCPVHGGKDGFRLFKDYPDTGGGYCNTCGAQANGFAIVAWVRGYSIKDAVRDVARWLHGEETAPTIHRRPPPPKVPDVIDPRKAYGRIRKAWTESTELQGTPAEAYLANRGIWKENMPVSLRAHAGLSFWDAEKKAITGTFPCLLAPIKDKDGRIVSLHRIYLSPEGGKAPVDNCKKMMSPCAELRGAAIKLFQAGDVLGVAEGIETALAAHAISRMPVWSCISATLMELVDIPDSVRKVVIWADLDHSKRGLQAAEKLAARLREAGKEVEICLPTGDIPEGQKGVDWLDVLLTQGLEGFPSHWRRWTPELTKRAA